MDRSKRSKPKCVLHIILTSHNAIFYLQTTQEHVPLAENENKRQIGIDLFNTENSILMY